MKARRVTLQTLNPGSTEKDDGRTVSNDPIPDTIQAKLHPVIAMNGVDAEP